VNPNPSYESDLSGEFCLSLSSGGLVTKVGLWQGFSVFPKESALLVVDDGQPAPYRPSSG
jgi:hypothetical protein